ncbi:MAG: hypothetical protein JW772_00190 [Candidatus Diapherotrites archaeon]|nr:hypothetical protein [Candidatus Diapherotrites archaeon]
MNFKAILLAIAVLFFCSTASAYYVWGGSYGALEYPNSYYSVYSYGSYPTYNYYGYGGYNTYYHYYTPYSTYQYSYTSWNPYNTYYSPAYVIPSGGKFKYWSGFGATYISYRG